MHLPTLKKRKSASPKETPIHNKKMPDPKPLYVSQARDYRRQPVTSDFLTIEDSVEQPSLSEALLQNEDSGQTESDNISPQSGNIYEQIPENTFSAPQKKIYVNGERKLSQSGAIYHDTLLQYRKQISRSEANLEATLKTYFQEKKKRKKKKNADIKISEEKVYEKTLFPASLSRKSKNSNQRNNGKKCPKITFPAPLKSFFLKCKTGIEMKASHIYSILLEKNIVKEACWTSGIVAFCVIIGFFLYNNQSTNMVLFSVSGNTILLPETGLYASISDNGSEYEDDEYYDDEYYDDEYYDDEYYDDEYYDDEYYDDEYYYDEEEDLYDDYEDEYSDTEEETSEEYDDLEDTYEDEYISPVDFDYLQKSDADIYAWIYVPGTGIDAPIIQNGFDDYSSLSDNYIDDSYSDTDDADDNDDNDTEYTDTEDFTGYIFTDGSTATDFSDNNTIIYGHNMQNGTMFSDLYNFSDDAFFREYDSIYIYTPEEELNYTIFAAYLFSDIDLSASLDFSDPEIFDEYLEEVLSLNSTSANIRKEVEVTGEDRIITLITTVDKQPGKRFYVQAVLNTD